MPPKISIIVPCWNVEKFLNRCIEHLIHQTFRDIEIILVDDQSPDNVPVMCDEWAKKDERIKVVHKKNEGLGCARNTGMEVAKGDYITFCDSDDYIDLDAYQVLIDFSIKNQLDVCYFKHRRVKPNGEIVALPNDAKTYFFYGDKDIAQFRLNMIGRNPFVQNCIGLSMSVCMALFKRSVLIENHIRFLSERKIASEDLLFQMEVLSHVSKVAVLPFVYYNYLINPYSITTTFNDEKYQKMRLLLSTVKSRLLQDYSWEEIKYHYYSQQLRILKIVLKFEAKSNRTVAEKIIRLKNVCKDPIFHDMLQDKSISKYNKFDYFIVKCMQKSVVLPLYLLYRFCK